jgi:hypothetical protein
LFKDFVIVIFLLSVSYMFMVCCKSLHPVKFQMLMASFSGIEGPKTISAEDISRRTGNIYFGFILPLPSTCIGRMYLLEREKID